MSKPYLLPDGFNLNYIYKHGQKIAHNETTNTDFYSCCEHVWHLCGGIFGYVNEGTIQDFAQSMLKGRYNNSVKLI